MPSQTKRRRLSLLSLPVVVVIGFLLVAKLAAWQRSDLIADLSDCIAHGETREAIDAVHKLAVMPNPPISVLVTAAAADEHETAEVGQLAISQLLRRWQREIESKHRKEEMADQLSELAKVLAEQFGEFSESDHAWLATTARKILAIANKLPPAKTPLVAVHCDAILTAVGEVRTVAPSQLAPTAGSSGTTPQNGALSKSTASTATSSDQESGKSNLGREFSAFGTRPADPDVQINGIRDENRSGARNNLPDASPPSANKSELNFGDGAANDRNGAPADDAPSQRTSADHGPSQPIFRILPAMPINIPPNGGGASRRDAPNARMASPQRQGTGSDALASVESRELLQWWLAGDAGDIKQVERELAKRGFGKLNTTLVKKYFSDDPEVRMRLVDDVLAQPGAGAGAWLLLFADDSNAEVRLFAVTFMATSNNAALMEKAWQVAIRDQDPRIADLAGRLRERREGALRR